MKYTKVYHTVNIECVAIDMISVMKF